VGVLLGLSKIGVTAALINTNLTHREVVILIQLISYGKACRELEAFPHGFVKIKKIK
jgi:hypothetical protein